MRRVNADFFINRYLTRQLYNKFRSFHFNIKTTERYLHVKKETLISISNVLDELNKTVTLEW
jgi:spore cortex formation protein SpoVR/YcgB (stage V sporulation)